MSSRSATVGATWHGVRRHWALGTLLVTGVALGFFSAAYPAKAPFLAPWHFSWIEYLATALPLLWYFNGVRSAPTGCRPVGWRQASFVIGMVAMYAVVQTRFEYFAEHLFFLTQTQQLILHDVGPLLVALSWPGGALARGMPVGAFLAFTQQDLYSYYDLCGRIFPWITPLEDQHIGGLMLWIPGGLMTAITVLLPLNAMRIAEESRADAVASDLSGRAITASSWTGR